MSRKRIATTPPSPQQNAADSPRVRLDALSWHLERQFGKKIAQCPNCGSHDLWESYANAAWNCNGCRHRISDQLVRWVPADPNAREPWEESEPEGMWLTRFHAEVRRAR